MKRPERGQFIQNGRIYINSTTKMFRDDINWCEFMEYISERFKNTDKVNTYIYGCSDGSEAYSLSFLLQNSCEEGEKFFPINAVDIDKELILDNINSNHCFLIPTKLPLSNKQARNSKQFFKKIAPNCVFMTPKTKSPIKFRCANILEDLDFIDDKNPSLVMARNMWPYVKEEEYQDFADKLYQKLAPKSVVVIGFYDYKNSCKFPQVLKKAGFVPYEKTLNNVQPQNCLVFEKN